MTNQVQQLVYEVFKSTHAFMLRMRDIGGAGEESLTDMLLPEINDYQESLSHGSTIRY